MKLKLQPNVLVRNLLFPSEPGIVDFLFNSVQFNQLYIMKNFVYSIANKYERFVFSSSNQKDPVDGNDLVKIVSYSMYPKSKLKPAISYLPINLARDYYRRLMTCDMNFKPVDFSNTQS